MRHLIEQLWSDVKFALRQLRKAPTFTVIAVTTLALGVGANSAMFALADVTLLRPLPYPDADRLVMIWERSDALPRRPVARLNFRDWAARTRTFERMGAITLGLGGGPTLTTPDGRIETVERQTVSTSFFETLGVTPVAGRTFRPEDDSGKPSVVVLSEGLWRARFGSDSSLIGGAIRLNGEPHTVVGIVSDSVRFARPASIWTLLPQPGPNVVQRGARSLEVIGRLKPGVTPEAAEAELSILTRELVRDVTGTNKSVGVTIAPLRAGLVGVELQLTSIFLLAVVGCVLIMCCANVANLLLARASVRERELALRAALGAGRARIVRQVLTESLVLAGLGGLLGVGVGASILAVAPSLIPAGLLPAAVTLTFDHRVAAFCAAATLVVGLLFGLAPALQATRPSLVQALASDSRSSTRGGGRFRTLLAGIQTAAAVSLLCGAGLLMRTLFVLDSFDPGYHADGDRVITMDFSVPGGRYSNPDALLQFYERVEREVGALPNVRSVGWASSLPWGISELGNWPFHVVGEAPVDPDSRPVSEYVVASPGYLTALNLPIVSGRSFNERDTRQAPPVCVVNEAFVRRHLQGRNPIGARIVIRPSPQGPEPMPREIIGVARQLKGRPDDPEDLVQLYVPFAQHPSGEVYLVVQPASAEAEALVPTIRAAVARQDPAVSVRRARTLDDLASEATARYRFRAIMVSTFAGLALVLAMIGVFGVLAYSVQQRWREFGVRIALGASTRNVLSLVLRSAARLLAAGVLVGLGFAVVLGQWIENFLFGVRPLDLVTFGAVVVIMALTATVAIAAPAWRATSVDPVDAFRQDT